jgi:two-component system, NarL family, nitrate/nitrite response regulator NarL
MRTLRDTHATLATRLFLIIENRMLREAMSSIFHKQSEFSVVGAVRYDSDSFALAMASQCDILLADQASASAFPNNFVGDLLRVGEGRKAILFGMDDDPDIFLQAVRSGVSGYLLGEASADDMIKTVRRVVSGEASCPPKLCHHLFQFVAQATREGLMVLNQRLCRKLGLTTRQQQIVAHLARGFTNKEIAESMNLSEYTIKNHVHRIMRQLNADSRHAAVQTVCDRNPALSI